MSDLDLQKRVVKGFHGLHHYANESWFQHLLQYAKADDPVQDEDLNEPLDELQEFWKPGRAPGGGPKHLKLDDTTSADNIATQLEILKTMPIAYKMGLDVLTFRKFLSQEKYSHQTPESTRLYPLLRLILTD